MRRHSPNTEDSHGPIHADIHARLRSATLGSGWLLLEQLARALIGLSVGVLTARHLGPADYGSLAYVIAYLALFQIVATLSADDVIVRDLAQDESASARVLGSALLLRLVCGALCWVLAVAAAAWLHPPPDFFALLIAVAGSTLLLQTTDVVDLWLRSQGRLRHIAIVRSASLFVGAAIRMALIAMQAPLFTFVAAIALEAAILATLFALYYRRRGYGPAWKFDASYAKTLMRQLPPHLFGGFVVVLTMRLDYLFLQHFAGNSSLGIYSAAVSLATATYMLPMALSKALTPSLSGIYHRDPAEFHVAISSYMKTLAFLGFCVGLFLWIFRGDLVTILFGSRFSGADHILGIYSIVIPLVFIGSAQSTWFVVTGDGRGLTWRSIAMLSTTIVGGLALIARFGPEGAAYSQVLSTAAGFFLLNAFVSPRMFRAQARSIIMAPFVPLQFLRQISLRLQSR
jgi:PST family polysaccharide transporter